MPSAGWLDRPHGRRVARAGKWALEAMLLCFATASLVQAQTGALGQAPGMALASEAQTGDYLLGTMKLSSGFTDNVLLSTANGLSDVYYGIQPGVAFSRSLGWLHTTWEFSPWLVKYQKIDERDRLSGSFVTDFTARPWDHWTFDLNNSFQVRTNPPFDTFAPPPVTSTYYYGEGGTIIAPLDNLTTDEADFDVSYQPTDRTIFQGSLFYQTYAYHPIPGLNLTQGLVDSRSEYGRLQFYRQFSPRFLLGASYSLQNVDFSFTNHSAGVLAHSFVGVGTFKITPAIQLQLFGGPVLAHIDNQILVIIGGAGIYLPVSADTLSGTGGAIFSVHKDRTTMQLVVTRQVSGGSGFTGASQSNKADLSIRREFSSRWTFALSGQYALYTPIGPTNNTSFELHVRSAQASLTRRLTERLSLDFQITRGQQLELTRATRRYVDVDFAQFTLTYQFRHPIG